MRPEIRPEKPMTKERVIKHLYSHFILEKNPQANLRGRCVYNKTGCAIGCLFTKEDAEQAENLYGGLDVYFLEKRWPLLSEYVKLDLVPFLFALQDLHDRQFPKFLDTITELHHETHSQT